jgi:hypothetical protein
MLNSVRGKVNLWTFMYSREYILLILLMLTRNYFKADVITGHDIITHAQMIMGNSVIIILPPHDFAFSSH